VKVEALILMQYEFECETSPIKFRQLRLQSPRLNNKENEM